MEEIKYCTDCKKKMVITRYNKCVKCYKQYLKIKTLNDFINDMNLKYKTNVSKFNI